MNKRFSYLIVALLCLLGGQSAWADSWNSDDGKLTFTVIDEGQHHVSVKASSTSITGAVVVPATTTYESVTYTVTEVAQDAFFAWDGVAITSVTLPSTITAIRNYAFWGCKQLVSINIPEGVTYIGQAAFKDCVKLEDIVIPSSVNTVEDGRVFEGCSLNNFTLEDGDHYYTPFEGHTINAKNAVVKRPVGVKFTGIQTLSVSGGATRVTDHIAYKNSSLTSVTIGGNVTEIGTSAFEGCTNLTTVNITTDKLRNISDYAFYNCQKLASFTIPEGTESLGKQVFYYCSALKDMVIPSSVMYIGDSVFEGCSFNNFTFEDGDAYGGPLNGQTVSAKNVVLNRNSTVKFTGIETLSIGGSVASVADYIAQNAKTLTSVTIGGNVTTIGTSAFENCTNLVSVNITANVEQINNYAFWYCSALSEITIPATVWSIGDRAFAGCTNLGDVTIPASVTSVDNIFADAVMNSLTIEANSEPLGNLGKFTATDVVMNRKLLEINFTTTNLTIGGAITAIEDQQFKGKTFKTVTINSPVETIGVEAFEKCYSLTTITLPNTLTTIGNGAFYNCRKLEAITIPASVTSIGRAVFFDTPMLKDVVIEDGATELYIDNNYDWYHYGADNAIEADLNSLYVGRNITMQTTADFVKSVKDITFGEGVTSIANLFKNNTAAENIHAPWATPITIAADEFSTTAKADATLWVPAGKKSTYAEATGWDFTHIQPTHYIVTLATVGTGTVTLDGKTEGDVLVAYDATDIQFTLAAGEDYDFASLNDGENDVYTPASHGATLQGGVYTLPSIADDMTFTATFTEKPKFTITATAGVGGTVNVQGGEYGASKNALVYRDRDAVVGVKCDNNYEIVSVVLDKDDVTSQLVDGKLTIANIQGAHNVNATFQKINLDVTLVATAGGLLTVGDKTATAGQNKTAVITRGQNVQLTVSPDEDYDFTSLKKGDVVVYSSPRTGGTYTHENLQDEPTFTATFTIKPLVTIAASATNGTATPSEQQVRRDRNATVTLTPNAGHYLSAVTVNGEDVMSQVSGNTLTLSNIQENQNVVATFTKYVYTISKAATENGTITLNATEVAWGENTTATITPATGYMIDHVFLNGVNADAQLDGNTLNINNVTENTEVSATFRILSYRVTVTGEGVTVDNEYPQHGEVVTITIAEDPDRKLTSLKVNDAERMGDMSGNTLRVTATGDLNVVATFRSTVEIINVNANGVGTYCCDTNLDFTDNDLKAYIAIGFNKNTGSLLLSRVYDVPAATPIYLKAEQGTYKVKYSDVSNSYYVNMLKRGHGTLAEYEGDYTNFFMKGGVFTRSNGTASVGTNRAYLQIPTAFIDPASDAKISVVFDDEMVDGIEDYIIFNQPGSDRIYNINGQQVNKAGKGVYIVNGKKILNK